MNQANLGNFVLFCNLEALYNKFFMLEKNFKIDVGGWNRVHLTENSLVFMDLKKTDVLTSNKLLPHAVVHSKS